MATYATLAEVKDYLHIGSSGTSNDILLSTFITSASRKIDDFLGYTFEVEYGSDESLYNVRDMDMIVLRKYPIVGISSMESGVDYVRRDSEGILILDNAYTGDFALSVSFGQGPPDTVKTTCMELVNQMWGKRQMTSGMKKMSMGDFSIEVQSGSSTLTEQKDILKTLDVYRDMHGSVTVQSYNQQR